MVSLKLRNYIHTSNMVCIEDDKLVKYETVQDIINVFCTRRFEMYTQRKKVQLGDFNNELIIEQNKYKFLKEVMSKEIKLFDQDEHQVIQDLTNKGYHKIDKKYDYLLNMSVKRFTKQELEKIRKNIKNIEEQLKNLLSMSECAIWEKELENLKI
jgi:DNA gyrase/topoisomerase IV subunit A